jgi:eukaryotic-like serine/threonine-protein kinase
MALAAGTKLGPYEIVGALGAGGMGEVYQAQDTRLNRTVAIKILPAALAADPIFRGRFEREAKTIASLTHPHICTLYDVGRHDQIDYLVMEHLEGETLAERLDRGALKLDEALRAAIEVADALDRAHRSGIVHRDLKPGNVFLVHRGGSSDPSIAKLLDFGLAKPSNAVGSGAGLSMLPTTPPGLTAQGTILGTFQYMAPEQLEGKEADARTDIFAFGAVLYEMVTGRKAFEGTSHASLISSIMSSQPPPVSMLQTLSPIALDQLVTRCLAKNPDDRWQSARDLKLQLAWIAELAPASGAMSHAPAKRSRERIAWATAGVALVALAGAIAMLATRGLPAAQVQASQFAILPPEKASFSPDSTAQAISPDGRQLVFAASGADGASQLWVRPFDALSARPLPGTYDGTLPFWSPDSRSIGFFARGKLKRIDAAGGAAQTLADASVPFGGTWNRDGVIVFAPNVGSPILRLPAGGGAPTPVTTFDQSRHDAVHSAPFFLPDGRHFMFAATSSPNNGSTFVGSLDSTDVKLVLRGVIAAQYSPPGYLVFVRESTLMAQPFDATRIATSGDAVPISGVGDGITSPDGKLTKRNPAGVRPFGAGFGVSETGSLVYRSSIGAQTQLVWVDRAGQSAGVAAPPGLYSNVALSADGQRLAYDRNVPAGWDVWILDLQRRITSRFTFKPQINNVPVWSPDGRMVAFATTQNGGLDIYQRPSNASGPDEPLLKLNATPIVYPSDWSSDGRFLTYYRTNAKTGLDVWVLPLSGDRTPTPFLAAEFNESQAQFSPDGKWMAYVSDESGGPQIYVQSFPMLSGKFQISSDGGTQPRWRRDGKELFYLAPDRKMMAVTVRTGATFEAGTPQTLFETTLDVAFLGPNYAVAADGQRFLLNTPVESASAPMTIVLNWPALLKK